MLAVGETVADALPTGSRGNQSNDGNGQAQQEAEHQKDQFDDAKDACQGK